MENDKEIGCNHQARACDFMLACACISCVIISNASTRSSSHLHHSGSWSCFVSVFPELVKSSHMPRFHDRTIESASTPDDQSQIISGIMKYTSISLLTSACHVPVPTGRVQPQEPLPCHNDHQHFPTFQQPRDGACFLQHWICEVNQYDEEWPEWKPGRLGRGR